MYLFRTNFYLHNLTISINPNNISTHPQMVDEAVKQAQDIAVGGHWCKGMDTDLYTH